MRRDRSAAIVGLATALTGIALFAVGYYLQRGPAGEPITTTQVVGIGVCYVGLLVAAIGGAVGMRKADDKNTRIALGAQIVVATLASIALAFAVILR